MSQSPASVPTSSNPSPAASSGGAFDFGASTAAAPAASTTAVPSATAPAASSNQAAAPSSLFGSTPSFGGQTTSAPSSSGFSFGGSTTASSTPQPAPSSSAFSFGGSTTASPAPQSTPSSSGFSFGGSTTASSTPQPAPSSSAFSFGGSTTKTPGGFGSFGAPASTPASTTSAPSFSFANTATPTATTTGSLFGSAATSAPAATPSASLFGAPMSTPATGLSFATTAAPTATTTGSLFGSTATPTPYLPFGAARGSLFGAAGPFGTVPQVTPTAAGPALSFSTTPAATAIGPFGTVSSTPGPFGSAGASTWGGFGSASPYTLGSTPGMAIGAPVTTTGFQWGPGHLLNPVSVERLFNQQDKFPDVILSYQGQDIYAHRAIIAIASPKLEKMFNSLDEPVKQEGKPKYYLDDDISGLQFIDVSRMIQFCYTGRFEACLPPVRLIEIALIAEHYEMRELSHILQSLCMQQLSKQVDVDQLVETLESAYKNGLEVLKVACMDALKSLPADRRFKSEDIARLDKDLLIEFLTHVTGAMQLGTSVFDSS